MSKQILAILAGLEPELELRSIQSMDQLGILRVKTIEEFSALDEHLAPDQIQVLCCGPMLPGLAPIELAQGFKMQFPGRPLIYAGSEKYPANKKELILNGFDQTFFMPFDSQRYDKSLQQIQSRLTGDSGGALLGIPLLGLKPGSIVDFDVTVMLPLNQKYVTVFRKGTMVRTEILDKFKNQNVKLVFIDENDRKGYRDYLKKHNTPEHFRKITKKERLLESLTSLFHDFQAPGSGTFESGKVLLESATKLVRELAEPGDGKSLLAQLVACTGQEAGDIYERSLRVATYTLLISALLNIANPTDLGVAGLLHDLGLSRTPGPLLKKSWFEMEPQERALYSQHPENSLLIMKEKRLVVVKDIEDAILGHHERPDGKGFPRGFQEDRISEGASILAMASAFDELTTLRYGEERLTPAQASHQLLQTGLAPEGLLVRFNNLLKVAA